MKLVSWNVNGMRAAIKNGFMDWFRAEKADVVCVQEIKATPDQLDPAVKNIKGYESHWFPAQKLGYSGVGVFTCHKPLSLRCGIGVEAYDNEGRVQTIEYEDFFLVNAYFPNTQRDHARLGFKLKFGDHILRHLNRLRAKRKGVILCGDYNVAHQEIDLKNPKSNRDNAGFLPEERAWMDDFIAAGYHDVFRERVPEGGHYTWWSYRPGVRARNIGWRIDYHCLSSDLLARVKSVSHQPHIKGSDHCPIVLELGS